MLRFQVKKFTWCFGIALCSLVFPSTGNITLDQLKNYKQRAEAMRDIVYHVQPHIWKEFLKCNDFGKLTSGTSFSSRVIFVFIQASRQIIRCRTWTQIWKKRIYRFTPKNFYFFCFSFFLPKFYIRKVLKIILHLRPKSLLYKGAKNCYFSLKIIQ